MQLGRSQNFAVSYLMTSNTSKTNFAMCTAILPCYIYYEVAPLACSPVSTKNTVTRRSIMAHIIKSGTKPLLCELGHCHARTCLNAFQWREPIATVYKTSYSFVATVWGRHTYGFWSGAHKPYRPYTVCYGYIVLNEDE